MIPDLSRYSHLLTDFLVEKHETRQHIGSQEAVDASEPMTIEKVLIAIAEQIE